ncbi:site-specific integrase [Streptomyces sp. MBT65]|uniref:tyrosine-type recombinase/integrase n=1 Tax=Streptomyces sp. MBT65 TaxID=1488395 RepID=UPI00190B4C7E|nr:site-specific integrase [Streptomyces sp. MBT65]MBK3580902.1 site-specific integrase [Streptomyces sp. MBT65]
MAGRKPQRRREFGTTRKLPSGRWQARYISPDGQRHTAPETFETKSDAQEWLNLTRADIERDVWRDPDAGAVNFEKYALRWKEERGLAPTTLDRYDGLLRLHILPTFGGKDLDEITPPSVRTWRAERLKATGATTVAKSYRLLKAILQTAVDDDLLRSNPCRIKGAGKEEADERPTATIEQVFDLADAMGPRWRLMVLLGAFASLRPEELAELRRRSVDLAAGSLRVTQASPELTNGRRVTGDPKTKAGKRTVYLPDFVLPELRRHMQWFAEKEVDGLLFIGEKGAPFRRSTFGRKWRKARTKVGMPDNFRFYDLRHTGNTLAADTGAKLKDLMVRAGQSSERAQLIYQHSTAKHQQKLAQGIDVEVRAQLREASPRSQRDAREA